MRVCIFGAGATGGFFAHRLASAGQEVSVVVRGTALASIRSRGLGLAVDAAEPDFVRVVSTDDPAALEPQDLVIVGTKATGLATAARVLPPLIGPETKVVFPQNGMPWWYPLGEVIAPYPLPDLPVFRHGVQFNTYLRPDQVLGGAIYSANHLREPGVVCNTSPGHNDLAIAPAAGGDDAAAEGIRLALREAGIGSPAPEDIRETIWRKLLLNMSGSTLAMITANRSSILREDGRMGRAYARLLAEGADIAAAWGYPMDVDVETIKQRLPHHHPSLLQDYRQGRTMEVGEIVLAPLAFADAAGLDCPALETVAAIVARLAEDKGLYTP